MSTSTTTSTTTTKTLPVAGTISAKEGIADTFFGDNGPNDGINDINFQFSCFRLVKKPSFQKMKNLRRRCQFECERCVRAKPVHNQSKTTIDVIKLITSIVVLDWLWKILYLYLWICLQFQTFASIFKTIIIKL